MTERSINTISSHALPLTEENFTDWLIDTRAHLRSKKLWKYTQEQYDGGPEIPEEGETVTAGKKRKEWQEKAEEAAMMTPTISPAIMIWKRRRSLRGLGSRRSLPAAEIRRVAQNVPRAVSQATVMTSAGSYIPNCYKNKTESGGIPGDESVLE
jgi:hypothetical protein